MSTISLKILNHIGKDLKYAQHMLAVQHVQTMSVAAISNCEQKLQGMLSVTNQHVNQSRITTNPLKTKEFISNKHKMLTDRIYNGHKPTTLYILQKICLHNLV